MKLKSPELKVPCTWFNVLLSPSWNCSWLLNSILCVFVLHWALQITQQVLDGLMNRSMDQWMEGWTDGLNFGNEVLNIRIECHRKRLWQRNFVLKAYICKSKRKIYKTRSLKIYHPHTFPSGMLPVCKRLIKLGIPVCGCCDQEEAWQKASKDKKMSRDKREGLM